MRRLILCAVSVVAVTGISFAQKTGSEKWKLFHGSSGFSVEYPGSWFPKGISTDSLTILSSRGGAEAVIIKDGQAMIVVSEEEEYLHSSLDQVIAHYITEDTRVLSRRTIRNEGAGTRGCTDLQEILSRGPLVPPEDVPIPVPYIINTGYFCEVKQHKYVTALRNFEGDKQQSDYQRIALRVAESIREDE
jgi:hypothetical protein